VFEGDVVRLQAFLKVEPDSEFVEVVPAGSEGQVLVGEEDGQVLSCVHIRGCGAQLQAPVAASAEPG
jgi:hypothetical protein